LAADHALRIANQEYANIRSRVTLDDNDRENALVQALGLPV